MHMYVNWWSPNNGDRNQQKQLTLWPISFTTFLYWLAILFIGITFLLASLYEGKGDQ